MPRHVQPPLLTLVPARKGRCESNVDTAVRAAYEAGVVDSKLDAAAVAMARTVARALDAQAEAGNPWAVAALARELRSTLERLRLDPVARGLGDRDEFAEFLHDLAKPTTAPVRDTP